MKYSLMLLTLSAALVGPSLKANADTTFTVDTAADWLGFMNWFNLPEDGGGYITGSPWDIPALVSIFDNEANTLTLYPNSIDDPSDYWYYPSGGPGAIGVKTMDANTYVQPPDDTLNGQTVTFEGTILSNTLSGPHVARAFIRDFAPDYGSYNESSIELTPGPFSISLFTDAGIGRHVQYGFNFNGPNVWITDIEPFGNVVIQTVSTAGTPGDFNGDGLVDGRDFLDWQRGLSPNALSPDDLTEWQTNYGAGGGLAAVSVVPEPASLTLVAAVASLLMFKRPSR
jgi:hypothetical protein